MRSDNRYIIKFNDLVNGLQTIVLPISADFFESVEDGEIIGGECVATLEANKAFSNLRLSIKIEGYVTVACDRCLEEVKIAVDYSGSLLVKFSNQVANNELIVDAKSEDTMLANGVVGEIDLKEYLYDSIIISLPLQRVHAEDSSEGEGCNPEMLARFGVLDNSNDEDWDDDDDQDEWDNEEE